MSKRTDRRCFLARGVAGVAAIGAARESVEERTLAAALASGTARPGTSSRRALSVDPGSLPTGKIGNVTLSRLFLGGNLIGGWAHSRDLIYASTLFRAYNTEAKIFETLEIAQACGINTIQIDPRCWEPILKYKRARKDKIQTMVCVPLIEDKIKMRDEIRKLKAKD